MKILIDNNVKMVLLRMFISLSTIVPLLSMNPINLTEGKPYIIKNFSGLNSKFSLIDEVSFDSLKKANLLVPLQGSQLLDRKPTFTFADSSIIHQYFINRKERFHLFPSYNDYLNFFDSTATDGVAIDYDPNYRVVYFYLLKVKTIREVFRDLSRAEVLFTFPNKLYTVYKVQGYDGVFMVANNEHFNQAFWYPDYETFRIDYEYLRKL